jgi:hypothetical protein
MFTFTIFFFFFFLTCLIFLILRFWCKIDYSWKDSDGFSVKFMSLESAWNGGHFGAKFCEIGGVLAELCLHLRFFLGHVCFFKKIGIFCLVKSIPSEWKTIVSV